MMFGLGNYRRVDVNNVSTEILKSDYNELIESMEIIDRITGKYTGSWDVKGSIAKDEIIKEIGKRCIR